jgi:hypothetical protein
MLLVTRGGVAGAEVVESVATIVWFDAAGVAAGLDAVKVTGCGRNACEINAASPKMAAANIMVMATTLGLMTILNFNAWSGTVQSMPNQGELPPGSPGSALKEWL